MTRQIALEFGDGVRAQEAAVSVDAALAELVDAITVKEAAWRLEVAPATVHKKLHREDRHQVSLREMVILLVTAPKLHQRALLDVLARACGFVVDEAPELTPEQELERVYEQIGEVLSPKQVAELKRKARGTR